MAAARVFADRDGLAPVVLAAFGQGRPLTGVQRLRDASKKGVYRLGLGGGGSVIAYVWDAAENYWAPGPAESPGSAEPTGPAERPAGPGSTDVFADASGPDLFSTAHALLDGLGVRTPAVYLLDRSRSRYPAGIALVEDIPGETLEARLELGRPGAEAVTARLGEVLRRMHQHRGEQWAGPGQVSRASRASRSCWTGRSATWASRRTGTGGLPRRAGRWSGLCGTWRPPSRRGRSTPDPR
ncbi:MAG: phosphotransferase [Actinomycetota bacterium]